MPRWVCVRVRRPRILLRDERPKLRRHVARFLPPSVDRVARIWEKLAEPEACLVIGHLDADRDVVAMALAEPGRAEHGAGAVIPGYGHVSMVFVHPDMWGRGEPPAFGGTSRACVGKRLEPHDAVDPGVERARSTPVRRPGISKVRP